MPTPSTSPSSPSPAPSPISSARFISIAQAALTWLVGWLVGNIAGSVVIAASGGSADLDSKPVWVVVASSFALWIPQIVALVIACRRFATGHPLADLALRFRPIDLVGIPVGVLSQLVLLALVYWPLQRLAPGTFSDKQLEENARDLYDRATGAWIVVLVIAVAVVAPFVEELVYRGLLLGAARRRLNDLVALVAVAAFFAAVHFRPVEFAGLFAFGLVLGVCVLSTDRIGMSVVAHIAFNATALALVAH